MGIALTSSVEIAEIGAVGIPLQRAHLEIGAAELPAQAVAIRSFDGHPAQIIEAALHQDLAGGHRTGEFTHAIVDLEQHGVGERADVVQAGLGDRALFLRGFLLAARVGRLLFGVLFLDGRLAPACFGHRTLLHGDRAFAPRDARLPDRGGETDQQRHAGDRRCQHRQPVARARICGPDTSGWAGWRAPDDFE